MKIYTGSKHRVGALAGWAIKNYQTLLMIRHYDLLDYEVKKSTHSLS